MDPPLSKSAPSKIMSSDDASPLSEITNLDGGCSWNCRLTNQTRNTGNASPAAIADGGTDESGISAGRSIRRLKSNGLSVVQEGHNLVSTFETN